MEADGGTEVRLKVDIVECPETGTLIEHVLKDELGRIVFRFGLVGPADPAFKNPLYGVSPGDLGLQTGQWVELEPVQ